MAGLCDEEAGRPAGDAGPGDGGPSSSDAGDIPVGRLEVLGGAEVEFGAQLLGVPVTREVTLVNVGDAALTLLAVVLDDPSGEFSASPTGTLSETLEPGESYLLSVSHTPEDGVPDTADLKVLHDGEGNLLSITLFAEFKGDAALSVSDALEVTLPNLEVLDFGALDPGAEATRTLWIRNTGRSDSILTLSDVTITPAMAGFSLEDAPALPVALGAWSAALCEDDASACPPGGVACQDGVCVDEEGEPLHALALRITFQAGDAPAEATLTLEHDAAGVEGSQTDVLLVGAPTKPVLEVSPQAVNFGVALVGATPAEETVVLSNLGEGPLVITQVVEPNELAFTFAYSRPVPRVPGDAPLVVLPEGPMLEITARFEPTSASAYTGFLTIRSNDPAQPQLTLPLQGAGIVCQDNAHVNEAGECECDEGYLACGDECLLEGPDACGPSCTVCETRTGAERACVEGTCVYSCTEQRYDLNEDRDLPQGEASSGCEYLCPVAEPKSEQCNSIDDDCDGVPDNGLAPDGAEPNDACSAPFALPAVRTGGASQWSTYTLYPSGDTDWFLVRVEEANEDICTPCLSNAESCEHYRTRFRLLNMPEGLDYRLEVRRADLGCGSTPLAGSGGTEVTESWSACPNTNGDSLLVFLCGLEAVGFPIAGDFAGCGFNDVREYLVRVRTEGVEPQSCETYTLEVSHDAVE